MIHEAEFLTSLESLLKNQHPLTNLANVSAMLREILPDINWVGFYLLDSGALCLGPFQGKPACTRIQPGKGVCGTAFAQDKALIVPDVHAFPGHIACDAASRSEIVLPIHHEGQPIGVLDIDSPSLNRFTEADRALLKKTVALLEKHCDFTHLSYTFLP